MKQFWRGVALGLLTLVLALAPALAAEVPEEAVGQLLDVTVGTYTPAVTVQAGARYTLIVLPAASAPDALAAQDLASLSGQAMFLGSALAGQDGRVTFQNVRLRTAQAAVYYVVGPGLDVPYREATSASTEVMGCLTTASRDHSAQVTLMDKDTGYHYNTGFEADPSGFYYTNDIAPGKYILRVNKPGYLPYATGQDHYLDLPDRTSSYLDLDIAQQVGDVTGDGLRDMTDLAALLLYYGRTPPAGITADLDYNGSVGQEDAALLCPYLTTGTGTVDPAAALTVLDDGQAADAGVRCLSFSLEGADTVSAAAFTLTYRPDAVQPLTPQGGLMAPVDGGALASCLVGADGFTTRLTSWQVTDELVTLSFSVTADTPQPAGEVARFYYRPVSGSTDGLYAGVLALPHAAALAGRDTVVTAGRLTYPNCDYLPLEQLTIDQSSPQSLTIPAVGRTAVLLLSATGRNGEGVYPQLSGVTWRLDRQDGKPLDGLTVADGLLTVTSAASAGTVEITAARDGVTSAPLTLELTAAPSVASSLVMEKDGQPCTADSAVFAFAQPDAALTYTVQFLDQYDAPMAPDQPVRWSLSGAPEGLVVREGVLTPDWARLRAGTYRFTVHARTGLGLQATVTVELTVEPTLGSLSIAGALSAIVPGQGGTDLTLPYVLSAFDTQGAPMALPADVTLELSPGDAPASLSAADGAPELSNTSAGVALGAPTADGDPTLTVSPEALAGSYTLTARSPAASTALDLTLASATQQTAAHTAAVYHEGRRVHALRLSLPADQTHQLSFTAQLLDAQEAPLAQQPDPSAFTWTAEANGGAVMGILFGEDGSMTVDEGLAPGVYCYTLTVQESDTGLATSVPLTLTLTPVLGRLSLDAPAALTIPAGRDLVYPLGVNAWDSRGNAMALPEDLVWSVSAQGTDTAVQGVTVAGGVLTLTPEALPGTVTVTVSGADGAVSHQADITLEPNQEGAGALILYRQVTIDGAVAQPSGPVPDGDRVDAKEGQSVVVTYTPMLVDLTTGQAAPIDPQLVQWKDSKSSFTVDGNAQRGVYSAAFTAVYAGNVATAQVQVTVHPNITDLRLDFGSGLSAQPPYSLTIPSDGSRSYLAAVLAVTERNGTVTTLPLGELGLADYTLAAACDVPGVRVTVDQAADTVLCTVDPSAAPGNTGPLQLTLDYFPGQAPTASSLALSLVREPIQVQDIQLRWGTGEGTDFNFDVPGQDAVTVFPGSLSNCYALELLDQYGVHVVDHDGVVWTLTGGPKDDSGKDLVTLVEPDSAVAQAHPHLSALRRLRIDAAAPAGTYPLKLKAVYEGFTRTHELSLTVKAVPVPTQLSICRDGAPLTQDAITLAETQDSASGTYTFRLLDQYDQPIAADRVDWALADGGEDAALTTSQESGGALQAQVTVTNRGVPVSRSVELTVTASYPGPDGQSQTLTAQLPIAIHVPAPVAVRAVLRRGVRIGTGFTFDAPASDALAVPAGSRSNCYSLTLLDRWGKTVTAQEAAAWTLSGGPKNAAGKDLITLVEPGGSVADPGAVDLRRLRVDPAAPAGQYDLTLTAALGGLTAPLPIRLEVSAMDALMALTGPEAAALTIPRPYLDVSQTTPNSNLATASFSLALGAPAGAGYDLDLGQCKVTWQVTDAAGVTLIPGVDDPNTAALLVDRTATAGQVVVTAALVDEAGTAVGRASFPLTLTPEVVAPPVRVTQAGALRTGGTVELTAQLELAQGFDLRRLLAVTALYRDGQLLEVELGLVDGTGTIHTSLAAPAPQPGETDRVSLYLLTPGSLKPWLARTDVTIQSAN